MIDLTEKQYVNICKIPTKKTDTIAIDNGVFEIKAGFINDLSIVVRNRVYKNKDKISFDPFPNSTVKTMFDNDVIINFDTLEYTMDLILGSLDPSSIENLIITSTPYSPTEVELVEYLFESYKFNKIQVGFDFIYNYHKYFKKEDCLIVDFKYSSIVVCCICDEKISEIYKVNFGGKDLLEYINYIMIAKYREFRKDYKNLAELIRVADNYEKEAVEIYNEMCNGEYKNNVFLSEMSEEKTEKETKKIKKNTASSSQLPLVNYELLAAEDNVLDKEQIKEKRRHKMIYFSTMYRLKTKIEKCFVILGENIENIKDELEKQKSLKSYIAKKKAKFNTMKRELELRDKLRKDVKNKKSREFQINYKEGALDEDEQRIKNLIADAEDEEQEERLIKSINELADSIRELDPDFIPFYANTVEILRGDNIGRQCVNVELIKWAEIMFDPSIIGSEQMGLSEIFEHVSQKHAIGNVLVCGGFSYIKNMARRIENELNALSKSGPVTMIQTENIRDDPFNGMQFSKLCPTYTRADFEKYGAKQIVERNKTF
jgi:actin-related protein 5